MARLGISIYWKYPLLVRRVVRNWFRFLWNHTFNRNGTGDYFLRTNECFRLRHASTDRSVLSDVYIYRLYSRPGFDISPGDTVIDIGAHIGVFGIMAAWRCRPAGRVFCMEPFPENLELLRLNTELNRLDNLTCVPFGIAGTDCSQQLFVSPTNAAKHSCYERVGTPVTIECMALQTLFDRYDIQTCDYLKMDCEGAEYAALTALPAPYFARIRRIVLEFHETKAGFSVAELAGLLEERGFAVEYGREYMVWGITCGTKMLYAVKKDAPA